MVWCPVAFWPSSCAMFHHTYILPYCWCHHPGSFLMGANETTEHPIPQQCHPVGTDWWVHWSRGCWTSKSIKVHFLILHSSALLSPAMSLCSDMCDLYLSIFMHDWHGLTLCFCATSRTVKSKVDQTSDQKVAIRGAALWAPTQTPIEPDRLMWLKEMYPHGLPCHCHSLWQAIMSLWGRFNTALSWKRQNWVI